MPDLLSLAYFPDTIEEQNTFTMSKIYLITISGCYLFNSFHLQDTMY